MRKYFLTSAVALMISGTANAAIQETAYMSIEANVTTSYSFSCTDLNLGNIQIDYRAECNSSEVDCDHTEVMFQANGETETTYGFGVHVLGYTPADCSESLNPEGLSFNDVQLYNDSEEGGIILESFNVNSNGKVSFRGIFNTAVGHNLSGNYGASISAQQVIE
ncbi:MAG: hypothetical protein IJ019_02220 [Alphaproteobacteria bacterium]|nr:hypothetical protein [Alphaproteobacteria bacterium]